MRLLPTILLVQATCGKVASAQAQHQWPLSVPTGYMPVSHPQIVDPRLVLSRPAQDLPVHSYIVHCGIRLRGRGHLEHLRDGVDNKGCCAKRAGSADCHVDEQLKGPVQLTEVESNSRSYCLLDGEVGLGLSLANLLLRELWWCDWGGKGQSGCPRVSFHPLCRSNMSRLSR